MKSIIFNTEMVKAVLDGRKTQTRRAINYGLYIDYTDTMNEHSVEFAKNYCDLDDCTKDVKDTFIKYHEKYDVGDILYVRETFKTFSNITMYNEVGVIYKADNKEVILPCNGDYECEYVFNDKWKPSVHMPKKYARIFLKVTNVRVEKIQDISLEDMLKEGINHKKSYNYGDIVKTYTQVKREFINNWNSKEKDGYKWEDNSYVFVYEFERINKED